MDKEQIVVAKVAILHEYFNICAIKVADEGHCTPDEILTALLALAQTIAKAVPHEHRGDMIKVFKAATEGIVLYYNENPVNK